MPDLLYLIRLRLRSFRLKVENFLNVAPSENVMVFSNPLLESEAMQQSAQPVKGNIGVGCAAKNLIEKFVNAAHHTLSDWLF